MVYATLICEVKRRYGKTAHLLFIGGGYPLVLAKKLALAEKVQNFA
jgi:cobyrinic acid a,c-diamide synthase